MGAAGMQYTQTHGEARWRMSFETSWKAVLLFATLAVVFARLGSWQWARSVQKASIQSRIENAAMIDTLDVGAEPARFTRVDIRGSYDPDRHFLIDNRVHNTRAGVHVLSLFKSEDGVKVLVNRGWLPMPPDRRSLPVVTTPRVIMEISGYLDRLPLPGKQLGEADETRQGPWPQLLTYPVMETLESALATELFPLIIMLDATSPAGFEGRDWQPIVMGPQRHQAYAVQWYGLAITAVLIWLVLGLRRNKEKVS